MKFSVKLLLAITIVFVALIMIEVPYRAHLGTEEKMSRQSFLLSVDSKPCDTLFLGDSFFVYGIDSTQLSKQCCNYSRPGASFRELGAFLEYLTKANRHKPKVIYLEVNFQMFGNRRSVLRAPNSYLVDSLISDQSFSISIFKPLQGMLSQHLSAIDDFHREAGSRVFLTNLLASEHTPTKNKNKKPSLNVQVDSTWCRQPESSKHLEGVSRVFSHNKRGLMNDIVVSSFERILDLAVQYDIKVILVLAPLSKYYNNASSQTNLRKYRNYIASKSSYQILNFERSLEDYPCKFKDCDHLNAAGAAEFTAQLLRSGTRL